MKFKPGDILIPIKETEVRYMTGFRHSVTIQIIGCSNIEKDYKILHLTGWSPKWTGRSDYFTREYIESNFELFSSCPRPKTMI